MNKGILLSNIDKIHTTKIGVDRIKKFQLKIKNEKDRVN